MARSEVFNTDCIEYMRSLPSKYFDLAVCDPPFGKGNDDTLETGGQGLEKDSAATTSPIYPLSSRGRKNINNKTMKQAD